MSEQKETWVTTLDNPFNPFKDRDNWQRFDEDHGYFTTNLIARISNASNDMSEDAFNFCIEQAVDEICRFNVTGNYRKVIND